jgi:hypothetical protein
LVDIGYRIVETCYKNGCFKKFEDLRILGGCCARTRGGGLSKSPKVATIHTPLRNEHLT